MKNKAEALRTENHTKLGSGLAIDSSNCSTGFTATKGTTRFLVTAGHCLTGNGTSSVNQNTTKAGIDHFTTFYTTGYDVALIRIDTARTITSLIYKTAGYDAKYTQSGSFMQNQLVCKSGITTEYTCGTVVDSSVDWTDEDSGNQFNDQVKIQTSTTDYSQGGDSGSITWAAEVLLGVHSGGGDSSTLSWGYAAKTSQVKTHFGSTFEIYKSTTPL